MLRRVPQILRHYGILEYSNTLAEAIDNLQVIAFGSIEEIEIRASTIIAVDLLRDSMMKYGRQLMTIELDWLLWQQGENAKDSLLPHHRTLTIYY